MTKSKLYRYYTYVYQIESEIEKVPFKIRELCYRITIDEEF